MTATYTTKYDPYTDSWTVTVTGLPIGTVTESFTVAQGGSKRAKKFGEAHVRRTDW